jgi:GTP-binding protein Era
MMKSLPSTPSHDGSGATDGITDQSRSQRCGYVALLGRPNAGKSTLLNALLEEHLSIVTPKAQTTWQRVTGILTTERAQMIFLDTPGVLEPSDLLQRSMLAAAREALGEADVVVLVLDGSKRAFAGEAAQLLEILETAPAVPRLAAINKIDLMEAGEEESVARWVSQKLGVEPFPVCAVDSRGVERIRTRLEELLPPGPFLYPPDEIARDPVRFFVAEMIRETTFHLFHQEIPYSVFVQVEEFREKEDPIYIQANIFTEKKSQKRILVGSGGSSIRKLGTDSRRKIEAFLGRGVYLDLWVKVLPNWRQRRRFLKRLGFSIPQEGSER